MLIYHKGCNFLLSLFYNRIHRA